jgi:hypothetical protein
MEADLFCACKAWTSELLSSKAVSSALLAIIPWKFFISSNVLRSSTACVLGSTKIFFGAPRLLLSLAELCPDLRHGSLWLPKVSLERGDPHVRERRWPRATFSFGNRGSDYLLQICLEFPHATLQGNLLVS